MKRMYVYGLLCCFVFGATGARAQEGGIRGVALDADFEVPLPGVKVRISETGQETETGDAGTFVLEKVAPGAYTLLFSKSGYTRFTKPDIVVSPGYLAEVEASLAGEYEEMDELVVRDIRLGGSSEIGLLNLRMESSALMDSVGADLMSRAGASDAAGALKLVAGATVQDGKYAVVRGLPDRYVSSQMNQVRLPTADPDKRAVQLDQFPSALIESIQVSKTFTPDQQGDASGGAVNVVLKGIPEETILEFKVGAKYRTNLSGRDFLTYDGGGLNYWGTDTGSRSEQISGTRWDGAYGVSRDGEVPFMYDWSATAGGSKKLFDGGVRVGGLANFFYKHDASSYEGYNDKYWMSSSDGIFGGALVPHGIDDANGDGKIDSTENVNTSLYDIERSVDKVQWGLQGAIGVETENNKLKLLYMQTHVAEDKTTVAEDTRGKEYVYPGYDPYDPAYANEANNNERIAPYRRSQTLEYSERDTDTLQFSGTHTLPIPMPGIDGVFELLEPEFDWTVAQSSSSLDTPDKRSFSSFWSPAYSTPGVWYGPYFVPGMDVPATYSEDRGSAFMGNVERVWREVSEESRQFFMNGKLPFEQWSGEKGFLKLGMFNDQVDRSRTQNTYSNFKQGQPDAASWEGDWSEFWSDHFGPDYSPNNNASAFEMSESTVDVSYDAEQEIRAWYWMADMPLSSFLKVVGGVRYEETSLSMEYEADEDVFWVDSDRIAHSFADDPPPESLIDQQDVLPSIGLEVKPIKSVVFRLNYAQTVARPTFKEISPVAQDDYSGGETFVGNPELQMSALKNYDARMDWAPYPGGLVSCSWFLKEIEDPIEYVQDYSDFAKTFTTAVNYPEGTLEGYEMEIRQSLGHYWGALEGLTLGGNLTLIDSEVTLSDADSERLQEYFGFEQTTRDMLNAPEYLYNVNATYDIAKFGTRLGLFYTVTGDTLIAGEQSRGNYVPSVYAKEYGTLNFSISQKLGAHWSLGFKAKNLTDPDIDTVYRSQFTSEADLPKSSYKKGREYSLSLSTTW